MRRIKALGVCLLLLTMLLSTCPASADDGGKGQPEYTRLDEISGKNIGVITGFDEVLRDEKLSQKNTFTYYPTATDTVMALKAGRVDVVCLDEPVAQLAVNTNEGIAILPENLLLNVQIEYSEEEGIAQVRVRYNGPALDPTVSGDEISMALVKNAVKKLTYLGCTGQDGLNTVLLELGGR